MRDGDENNIIEVRRGPGARGKGSSGKGGRISRRARHVGTFSRVRELSEWMRDDAYSEVLVGRLFVTLGVKFAELARSERKFRARAVYQGSNIWSRSGRSVYEIFDEVSDSPSSLTAARTAMAVGMMRGMIASYRDASNAYLQALIDVEPGVINLDELPRSWWPRSWFEDDAMTIPKYKHLAIPLVYALPATQSLEMFGKSIRNQSWPSWAGEKSRIGLVCSFMLTSPSSAYMWMTS